MGDEARAAAERGYVLSEPDDAVPAIVLSDTLRQLDNDKGALAAADVACARAADVETRRDALVAKALAYVRLERGRHAIAAAQAAVDADPEHARAWDALAAALATADRWGEAARAVAHAEALAPDDPDIRETAETVRKGLAMIEGVLVAAEAEAKASSESFDIWVALGAARMMAGRLDEAEAAFARAHALNPDPNDRWPDEPYMLSPWEADCYIARREEEIFATSPRRKQSTT
jgi:tetratricopeptide (TPR) repeat protein